MYTAVEHSRMDIDDTDTGYRCEHSRKSTEGSIAISIQGRNKAIRIAVSLRGRNIGVSIRGRNVGVSTEEEHSHKYTDQEHRCKHSRKYTEEGHSHKYTVQEINISKQCRNVLKGKLLGSTGKTM